VNDVAHDSAPGLPPATKRRRHLLSKIAAWTLAAAATLIVLAAIAIVVLLHNERFHNYVLAAAQQKASDSLGVRVQLQNFAVNLSHLDLDLYGITVDGAAPYASPPLLQMDHAEIGVRIVSILHGKASRTFPRSRAMRIATAVARAFSIWRFAALSSIMESSITMTGRAR